MEFTWEFVHGWVREIGWGHWWMCRQVGMTLLHMHKGFSCLDEEAGDCDVIRWCHCHSAYVNEEGGIKGSMHEHWGSFFGSSFFGLFSSWFVLEVTDPLSQLPQCLLRSGIITIQESVLYLFICMCSRLSWAYGINCDLSKPTKFTQHPQRVTYTCMHHMYVCTYMCM